jgi:hypothetical protein
VAFFRAPTFPAIFLSISSEMTARFYTHPVPGTGLYKDLPEKGPERRYSPGARVLRT